MPGLTNSPHALSPNQERKLMDFLDDKFLNVTRNFKKRFVYFLMTRPFASSRYSAL